MKTKLKQNKKNNEISSLIEDLTKTFVKRCNCREHQRFSGRRSDGQTMEDWY